MAKARVFDAYEKALIILPFPDQGEEEQIRIDYGEPVKGEATTSGSPRTFRPTQTVEPFPRDPSELPQYARIAHEAFSRLLAESDNFAERRQSVHRGEAGRHVYGGIAGRRSDTREAGDGDERLQEALGAAREILSSYGRLEAELRVVEVRKNALDR